MTRVPAIWKAGVFIIIITFLVVGAYVGAQQLVAQQAPTVTPASAPLPDWIRQRPTCGIVPLLPCEVKR